MIQANNLRIGNLVWSESEGNVEVSVKLLERILDGVENVQGIDVADEWLRKFGFSYKPNPGQSWVDEDGQNQTIEPRPFWSHIYNVDGLKMSFNWYVDNKKANSCPCEFVHQLQNAFFVLTGREL